MPPRQKIAGKCILKWLFQTPHPKFSLKTVTLNRLVKAQQFFFFLWFSFWCSDLYLIVFNCLLRVLRVKKKNPAPSPSRLISQRGWRFGMFSHRRSSATVRRRRWCVMSLVRQSPWSCGTTRTKRSQRSTTVSSHDLISQLNHFIYLDCCCFW